MTRYCWFCGHAFLVAGPGQQFCCEHHRKRQEYALRRLARTTPPEAFHERQDEAAA